MKKGKKEKILIALIGFIVFWIIIFLLMCVIEWLMDKGITPIMCIFGFIALLAVLAAMPDVRR